MSDQPTPLKGVAELPQALVQTRRGLSMIWVVPIVALLIGGWLAFKAWSEQGPVITITFETAEGLEAGQTKIKFKDVEVGKVTSIDLNADLSAVVVTAEMEKSAVQYMTDATQFWVVRARVAAGEVTGLGTLFSGAYIGCNPSKAGKSTRHFTGLEKPPVLTGHLPGEHFVLKAETLGSLDIGAPVYYRGIKVGQVVAYDFDELADSINVRVFVEAPFHEKVRQNSRFWNASGVHVQLGTEGVQIDTHSLVSILLGGVAFDLPKHLDAGEPAEPNHVFKLFADRSNIDEPAYSLQRYYLMSFSQNVRGLSIGAPVEIRGIKIGEVIDIQLEVDDASLDARVEVLVLVEPERIDPVVGGGPSAAAALAQGHEFDMPRMVDKGLRAQLKTGNVLTGQLYVELDFYPEAAPEKLASRNGYPVIPTVPAPLEQLAQRVNNILKQIEQMPLQQIGTDLRATIRSLDATLVTYRRLGEGVDAELVPRLNTALDQLQHSMQGLTSTLGPDSALNYNARKLAEELPAVLRSLRSLLDTLERDPQALLLGTEAPPQ